MIANSQSKVQSTRPANFMGGTRVARVQFGVAPNCVGTRALAGWRRTNNKLRPPTVSGATPDTTLAARVRP